MRGNSCKFSFFQASQNKRDFKLEEKKLGENRIRTETKEYSDMFGIAQCSELIIHQVP